MSPVLPREERDTIRARVEAATPGPWDWYGYGETGRTLYLDNSPYHDLNVLKTTDDWPPTDADAEFIAHARTDVPALLDALDAAEEENEREHREAVTWRDLARAEQDQRQAIQAERDAARAEVAALRGRIEHIVDRYGDAHDAKDCAVLHDLRALAADEGERTGR